MSSKSIVGWLESIYGRINNEGWVLNGDEYNEIWITLLPNEYLIHLNQWMTINGSIVPQIIW